MNVFITLTLLAAATSACPELPPLNCGPEEMVCPGPYDYESDCESPYLCVPIEIWVGKDSCLSDCPRFCGPGEMACPDGTYYGSNCPRQDICMPAEERVWVWSSVAPHWSVKTCPSFCPPICEPNEVRCPGDMDMEPHSGCPTMPDYCQLGELGCLMPKP